jgi:CRP-like cAMP-binding protein
LDTHKSINMQNESLEKYIQSILPLTEEKARIIADEFQPIEYNKNEFLFEEKKISKYTYFLENGFVRSYITDAEGDEVTVNIYAAPRFVNDFLSFFKQEPSKENFQTITACKMWCLTHDQVQSLFHSVPEFREFGRMMLVTNYSKLNDRMIGMIKDTAETRYLKLLNQYPDIFQHVPLKIIASYLGITDTSLSRIRKEIMRK